MSGRRYGLSKGMENLGEVAQPIAATGNSPPYHGNMVAGGTVETNQGSWNTVDFFFCATQRGLHLVL